MRRMIFCGLNLLILLLFTGLSPAKGSSPSNLQDLSSKAKASLLTIEPGDQLFSLFGHTSLRIKDPVTGIDQTYNYGTFDFNTDDFYWKFALGNLQYFLSITPFENAKKDYLRNGRAVIEQRLNLSSKQTKRLYNYLQTNAQPENRYYSYEFFYDNCTTRIFKAIKAATGDSLLLQRSLNADQKSYRQFINSYLRPVPWVKLGINILLGLPADDIPTGPKTLFLPDILKKIFGNANIQKTDTSVALVTSQTIYAPSNNTGLIPPLLTPKLAFWSLFFVMVPFGIAFPEKTLFWSWVDRILFNIVGGVGILIVFFWLFSAYPVTKWNANIVWTLIAPVGFFLFTTKKKSPSEAWRLTELIILGVLLISMTFFLIHQNIPAAIYPLFVLLIFRGWIYFLLSNQLILQE